MRRISTLFILLLLSAYAQAAPKTTLLVQQVVIDVNGKPGKVYQVIQPDGTWGYVGTEGEEFDARVINQTDKPMSMHWHGVVLPNDQDGVPGVTQADPIMPGAYQDFHYKLVQNGTFWMHTHYGFGEQHQLSAPMILNDPNDPYKNAKTVVMFLNDYTTKSFKEIESQLRENKTPTASTLPMSSAASEKKAEMKMSSHSSTTDGKKKMVMDMAGGASLNDVNFEVLLTNYKTLANPDLITVAPGQTIRLRIIDASVGSNFHLNLGKLSGTVIATDGHYIDPPVSGTQFSIAIAQRLDILVTIPKDAKESFPILAQVEGTRFQTGLILAIPGAPPLALSQEAKMTIGPINATQDTIFHAKEPFPPRPVTKKIAVTLDGSMKGYQWLINKQAWPNVTPLMVKKGDRVQITIKNNTQMAHPMHLHQYFQVMSINNKKLPNGPMRDTVYVPANGSVVIAFDANNPGNWMFHCHILYHQASGMMTVLQYEGVPTAQIILDHQQKKN
jgi:FtsP/CotA-like multicopper oxidase with cupredoxin domain